jgi:hypothetical protein
MQQYDVSDPFTLRTGSVHIGGIVRRATHPKDPNGNWRRTADGGGEPRRQAHLFHELSMPPGTNNLSGRRRQLDGEADVAPEGG